MAIKERRSRNVGNGKVGEGVALSVTCSPPLAEFSLPSTPELPFDSANPYSPYASLSSPCFLAEDQMTAAKTITD
jgi:hypothetical protein